MKLFCIPYAGGCETTYYKWLRNNRLGNNIDLIPVTMAGKGKRLSEPPYKFFSEAVNDCYLQIKNNVDLGEKYAVFGHSMGSWILYEMLKLIQDDNFQSPEHVFFSGAEPPFMRENDEYKYSDLTDQDFIKYIITRSGCNEKIFTHPIVGDTYLKILRSDYRLLEEYDGIEYSICFESDISVFYGLNDSYDINKLYNWKKCSIGEFKMYSFNGGHFFIEHFSDDVVAKIVSILNEY